MASILAIVGCLICLSAPGLSRGAEQMWPVPAHADLTIAAERRLIVTFKPTAKTRAGEDDPALSEALSRMAMLDSIQGVDTLSSGAGIHRLQLTSADDADSTIEVLEQNELVESVEFDEVVSILDLRPDDPYFTRGELWGIEKIKAPKAWEKGVGNKNVVVCVIDTGVDYNHRDLAGNMWRNPGETGRDSSGRDKATNGIDDDGNGVVDDVYGLNAINDRGDPMDDNAHGTHCAGTIGGVGNNALGVVGVAHDVSIMACKFLDSRGSGFTSDAIQCLDYALKMGATLTSNSWGGGGSSSAMSRMIDLAQTRGQIFVAAAGNSATNNDRSSHFPSNYPQDIVVSVASTTSSDGMSSFSNYGSSTVDLGAPGSNIVSTVPGNRYSSFSGTSMATPHVAGALALMYAYNPDLSATDAKRILLDSGESLGSLSGKVKSGKRLDVSAALEAMEPGSPEPTSEPTTKPTQEPEPGPCFICEDDPDYLFKGREKRGCDWIAKDTGRRCRNGKNVIGCPVTCGACKLQ